jgi:hypothetical protein
MSPEDRIRIVFCFGISRIAFDRHRHVRSFDGDIFSPTTNFRPSILRISPISDFSPRVFQGSCALEVPFGSGLLDATFDHPLLYNTTSFSTISLNPLFVAAPIPVSEVIISLSTSFHQVHLIPPKVCFRSSSLALLPHLSLFVIDSSYQSSLTSRLCRFL